MKRLSAGIVFSFVLLAGCSSLNNAKKQPSSYHSLPTTEGRAAPEKASEVQLVRGTQIKTNYMLFLRKGYVAIGYSLFQTLSSDGREVTEIAKKENANLAVAYKMSKTVYQIYLPTISPTANRAGTSIGSGVATGQMPLKIDGHDYLVMYWAKAASRPFGVYLSNPSPRVRNSIGVSGGAYVNTVINNTPANNADIVAGDVILAINHVNIQGAQEANLILHRDTGRIILVKIWHHGKTRTKAIELTDMGENLVGKSHLRDLRGKWNGKIYPIPGSAVSLDIDSSGGLSGTVEFNGTECDVTGQISQAVDNLNIYKVSLNARGSNSPDDSEKCLGPIQGFGYEDNRNLDNLMTNKRGNYLYMQYPVGKDNSDFVVFDLYR